MNRSSPTTREGINFLVVRGRWTTPVRPPGDEDYYYTTARLQTCCGKRKKRPSRLPQNLDQRKFEAQLGRAALPSSRACLFASPRSPLRTSLTETCNSVLYELFRFSYSYAAHVAGLHHWTNLHADLSNGGDHHLELLSSHNFLNGTLVIARVVEMNPPYHSRTHLPYTSLEH